MVCVVSVAEVAEDAEVSLLSSSSDPAYQQLQKNAEFLRTETILRRLLIQEDMLNLVLFQMANTSQALNGLMRLLPLIIFVI